MKRTALAAVAAVLTALGLAGAAAAGVGVDRTREVIDLTGHVEEGCDEPILLTAGTAVVTVQEFVDPNGRTHVLYHHQTLGFVGVGLESGATYRDVSHMTQTGIFSIEDGFATGGFTEHIRISSSDGAVADFVVRWNFRIVKRDRVNRVVIDELTVSCS